MQFIVNAIYNNTTSIPVVILCFMGLVYFLTKGLKFEEEKRIAISYIVLYLTVVMGVISLKQGLFIFVLLSFFTLEFLSEDGDRVHFLSFGQKIIDYFFRMIFEYHFCGVLFGLCIPYILNNCLVHGQISMSSCPGLIIWGGLISVVALIYAVSSTIGGRFKTETITTIFDKLNRVNFHDAKSLVNEKTIGILLTIEDRTFFERSNNAHTALAWPIIRRVMKMKRLWRCTKFFVRHPVLSMKRIRGFATIEMQLIRSIGIRRGYERAPIRRKIFEIIYSRMIFNAKLRDLSAKSQHLIKSWILANYLLNVRTKIGERYFVPGDKNTSQQMFGKNFKDLSGEQFFVWCLGLEYFDDIGPVVVSSKKSVIDNFGLDSQEILEIIKKLH